MIDIKGYEPCPFVDSYLRPLDPPPDCEVAAAQVSDESHLLPFALDTAGWQLLDWQPVRQKDPWVLYDPQGRIRAIWDKMPSYGDLLTEGGNDVHTREARLE